jgi:hypothetical protein
MGLIYLALIFSLFFSASCSSSPGGGGSGGGGGSPPPVSNPVYVAEANSLNIAFDSSGNPYICFIDVVNTASTHGMTTNCVSVMEYSTSSGLWRNLGNPDFSSPGSAYASMAIYNNTPYVAFSDGAYGSRVSVMYYTGSSWVYFGAPGFSTGAASFVSLTVDGSGNKYLAYSDASSSCGGKIVVWWCPMGGTVFSQLGAATGISAGEADWTSIAAVNSDNIYVVYEDYNNGNKATVMNYNSGAWSSKGTGFSAGKALYTGISVYNGTPYVVYSDGGNSGKLTVMSYVSGTTWTPVGSAGFTPGSAANPAMAIDPSTGHIYVAFSDFSVNTLPGAVMTYNTSSWSGYTEISYLGYEAQFPAIAVYEGYAIAALYEIELGVTVQNNWDYNWDSYYIGQAGIYYNTSTSGPAAGPLPVNEKKIPASVRN